jgi:hypothetical protein
MPPRPLVLFSRHLQTFFDEIGNVEQTCSMLLPPLLVHACALVEHHIARSHLERPEQVGDIDRPERDTCSSQSRDCVLESLCHRGLDFGERLRHAQRKVLLSSLRVSDCPP